MIGNWWKLLNQKNGHQEKKINEINVIQLIIFKTDSLF